MQRLACLTACMIVLVHGSVSGAMLNLEADTLQREGSRIEASGNVVVTGEDLTLRADYIVYDSDTDDIWAAGGCSLTDARGEVRAASLSYNARRGDLHIRDGSFTAYEGSMRLSGESISRYGQEYIRARSVEYTPCLGTPPDWSLEVEELDIPVGGYGQGRDVRFMVRRWPLLRIPWLLFPAKLYRHSGLLFPEMSHGSDYGYRVGLPVYVAVSRSVDATITPTWLTDRGLLAKGEFRYCIDHDRNGIVYVEALRDRQGGDVGNGGVEETTPERRWFFNARQTGENLNWDINMASTPDYFRDIGVFLNENPLQADRSSRDLNLLDDSRVESLVSRIQWVDSRWGLSYALSGRFTQDLTTEDNGQTIQQLPRFTARMRQRPIPLTPLKASAEIGTVRVATQDSIDAFKNRAFVELSLPWSFSPYFTFRPYAKEYYRDTRFSETDGQYAESSYAEHWLARGATLSTTLYSSRFSGTLEHQIVPEISLVYRSRYGGNDAHDDAQDIFPEILPGDEWDKVFDTELNLGNYIRDASGMSLADLTIGSAYSHREDEWREIVLEMNLRPAPCFAASHRNVLDRERPGPYTTVEHTSKMTLSDVRGDMLSLGYEYNRLDTKLLTAGLLLELGKGFSAGYEARYDHLEHDFTMQTQEIGYTSQCWAVELRRKAEASDEDSPSKTTWSVNVRLLGMGDIFQPGTASSGDRNDDTNP